MDTLKHTLRASGPRGNGWDLRQPGRLTTDPRRFLGDSCQPVHVGLRLKHSTTTLLDQLLHRDVTGALPDFREQFTYPRSGEPR